MKAATVLVLVLGACGGKGASDTGEEVLMPASGQFSALTYNVHGLPEAITGDDTAGRMVEIGPLLNAFDLVGLQEDFDDTNHQTLADASAHPTQVRFADMLKDRYYGSGLAVFAQQSEVDHHHEHYEACSGVLDGASDCLASKGFQVIRLQLAPGAELDVYNTHLEAGGGAEDVAARQVHVDQLTAAMAGYSAGRAVLFLGDTNLSPWNDEEDEPMWAQLMDEPGLTDSCDAVGCEEPNHIDRLLYRDGGGVTLEATAWTNESAFFDEDGVPLSDHPALSAVFRWDFVP